MKVTAPKRPYTLAFSNYTFRTCLKRKPFLSGERYKLKELAEVVSVVHTKMYSRYQKQTCKLINNSIAGQDTQKYISTHDNSTIIVTITVRSIASDAIINKKCYT